MKQRSEFVLPQLLLILAGLALAASTWLYWQPCAGSMLIGTPFDPFPTGTISQACTTQMDAGPGFPLVEQGATVSSAAGFVRTMALILLALAGVALATRVPGLGILGTFPAILTLALAGRTLFPLGDPYDGVFELLMGPIELMAIVAYCALVATRSEPRPGYFATVAVLLLATTSAGFGHLAADYAVMIGISQANWDTPPGTGYLTATTLIGCVALSRSSLLERLFSPHDSVLDPAVDHAPA